MAWRNDGSSWSGPQTAYGLWDKALWMPSRVSQGHRFIEIGALWRIGAVSTEYLSVGSRPTGKTAQVFADDGTIIDGPMLNYTIEKSARKNVPWMSNYYDLATFAPTGAAPSRYCESTFNSTQPAEAAVQLNSTQLNSLIGPFAFVLPNL